MMTLVTGLVGIALLVAFLGVMVWWIRALPFTIIAAGVVLLLVYDFVRTLVHGERGPSR